MTDGNASTTGDARRAIRQRLESLQRAGVTQIGLIPEFVAAVEEATEPVASQAIEESPAASVAESSDSDAPTESPLPPTTAESTASESPSLETGSDRAAALEVLASEVAACTLCEELCSTRTQTVFGVGDPKARLMFFGEAPGADEDRLGEPFVGAAGKLLTKIIEAMKLTRDDVYILNTLKCRPPGNRNPLPDEV
ncbi:MAG: uracil-DNA glycosylase family protein, partial [Planctomycetota bacterium]